MEDLLDEVKQRALSLDEAAQERFKLDLIKVDSGAIKGLIPYLSDRSHYKVVVVVDENTYEAAGKSVAALLEHAGFSVHITMIQPNAIYDVIADEQSILQLILDIQNVDPGVVLAVGAGTIHDIVRYASFTTGVQFVSVPTAPSVDGFISSGAPIILRGKKETIQAKGPQAIFADLDLLITAPSSLVAAGFGDMIGKYTSLFDWKFGSIVAGEPYSEIAADITYGALIKCIDHIEQISKKTEEGIHTLICSLIESGLAMLLIGNSHPASGSEHHLSHFWEMEYLRLRKKQLLHGAKVGVASTQISQLYHQIAEAGSEDWSLVPSETNKKIQQNWNQICRYIKEIPNEETFKSYLRIVGGSQNVEELSLDPNILERSLQEAHLVRPNRFTLLKAYNEKNDKNLREGHS